MTQLINKGGFRERANRSRNYKQSENKLTTLAASQYQPQKTTSNSEDEQKQSSISKDEQ
ncbi:hypothetical protein [Acinetobacter haemolyticus]|uniref:hypothetical protein n=1 Tax=Acinetobacter haemolyticus TaxID=29430 RepID=UPI00148C02B8|nr:hypothetical protein [Acinetobacter haemolyticus]